MAQPTAACVIIGDEILTGKVHDANSFALAKTLFSRGIRLARVETVPDDVDIISEAVRRLAGGHDHVFTSGGIGPTHDDVTLEAVGAAFDRPLAMHVPTLELMRAWYVARHGDDKKLNAARKKMALLPEGAEVILGDSGWVPVVKVQNVFVLPGVPGLFTSLLARVAPTLEGEPLFRRRVYTQQPEGEFAEYLSAEVAKHPTVSVGSYPHYDADDHKAMITLEGPDEAAIDALAETIRAAVDGFFKPEPEAG